MISLWQQMCWQLLFLLRMSSHLECEGRVLAEGHTEWKPGPAQSIGKVIQAHIQPFRIPLPDAHILAAKNI
jgi:hypothetical protein